MKVFLLIRYFYLTVSINQKQGNESLHCPVIQEIEFNF